MLKATNLWDAVELAGWKLPGSCAVSATLEQIRIVVAVTTREQLQALWPIMDGLRTAPPVVSISNPALDLMGIRAVSVASIGLPRLAGPGVLELEFDLRPAQPPERVA